MPPKKKPVAKAANKTRPSRKLKGGGDPVVVKDGEKFRIKSEYVDARVFDTTGEAESAILTMKSISLPFSNATPTSLGFYCNVRWDVNGTETFSIHHTEMDNVHVTERNTFETSSLGTTEHSKENTDSILTALNPPKFSRISNQQYNLFAIVDVSSTDDTVGGLPSIYYYIKSRKGEIHHNSILTIPDKSDENTMGIYTSYHVFLDVDDSTSWLAILNSNASVSNIKLPTADGKTIIPDGDKFIVKSTTTFVDIFMKTTPTSVACETLERAILELQPKTGGGRRRLQPKRHAKSRLNKHKQRGGALVLNVPTMCTNNSCIHFVNVGNNSCVVDPKELGTYIGILEQSKIDGSKIRMLFKPECIGSTIEYAITSNHVYKEILWKLFGETLPRYVAFLPNTEYSDVGPFTHIDLTVPIKINLSTKSATSITSVVLCESPFLQNATSKTDFSVTQLLSQVGPYFKKLHSERICHLNINARKFMYDTKDDRYKLSSTVFTHHTTDDLSKFWSVLPDFYTKMQTDYGTQTVQCVTPSLQMISIEGNDDKAGRLYAIDQFVNNPTKTPANTTFSVAYVNNRQYLLPCLQRLFMLHYYTASKMYVHRNDSGQQVGGVITTQDIASGQVQSNCMFSIFRTIFAACLPGFVAGAAAFPPIAVVVVAGVLAAGAVALLTWAITDAVIEDRKEYQLTHPVHKLRIHNMDKSQTDEGRTITETFDIMNHIFLYSVKEIQEYNTHKWDDDDDFVKTMYHFHAKSDEYAIACSMIELMVTFYVINKRQSFGVEYRYLDNNTSHFVSYYLNDKNKITSSTRTESHDASHTIETRNIILYTKEDPASKTWTYMHFGTVLLNCLLGGARFLVDMPLNMKGDFDFSLLFSACDPFKLLHVSARPQPLVWCETLTEFKYSYSADKYIYALYKANKKDSAGGGYRRDNPKKKTTKK